LKSKGTFGEALSFMTNQSVVPLSLPELMLVSASQQCKSFITVSSSFLNLFMNLWPLGSNSFRSYLANVLNDHSLFSL
jgi:hypothetical protein